jgi:hypothetical protein
LALFAQLGIPVGDQGQRRGTFAGGVDDKKAPRLFEVPLG